jgi:hypothetical protein
MSRVHKLPEGQHIAPMPPRAYGTEDARLPGGLPPIEHRTAWARTGTPWSSCRVGGERASTLWNGEMTERMVKREALFLKRGTNPERP